MKLDNNKNKILIFTVILALVLLLPLALNLTKQRQEIRKKAAELGSVRLQLQPGLESINRGAYLDINVVLNSTQPAVQVNAANVKMTFDKTVFDVSAVSCGTEFPLVIEHRVDTTGESGYIYLACAREGGTGPITLETDQPRTLGTFRATVKPNAPLGEFWISFINAACYVNEHPSGNNLENSEFIGKYTITSTTIPTPTPTGGAPTPAVTSTPGQVKIRLKIKFAGVETQKPDQKIRIKVAKDNVILQELGDVAVAAGSNGIYESSLITLSTAVTNNSGYYFLVKGPKHLQMRFCVNSGQNRPCSGSGNINLINGDNTLDFTGYPLPGGDLPRPGVGQDGVVNAYDAIYLDSCRATDTNDTCLRIGDLNFDGIISYLDFDILNLSIYSRWEDE